MVLTDWFFSLLGEALLFSWNHSSRCLVNSQRASSNFLHLSSGFWTLASIRFAGGICSMQSPGPEPQRLWYNRPGMDVRNLHFWQVFLPGGSVTDSFLSVIWEAPICSLFPFFISSPSLCQCRSAFQKERCFWRWGSHLLSHDFLLVVGRFHQRLAGFQILLKPLKNFCFFQFQRNTVLLLKILFINYKT